MTQEKPGVVQCKKGPDDESIDKDLRRKVDGVLTDVVKAIRMLDHFLDDLPPLAEKAEKIAELHKNIRPYVPDEFQANSIYAAPSKEQGEDAKAAQQARREHRAAMAVAAKANQVRRGRDGEDEGHPVPKKSRK
ncbi:hypothetical protein F443_01503 [Phytophthora nicotianae P1569]|uniref:Uncharacterized protein n=1 Tax=Phytophthora nicotianae P1569 TaxID=1317065 RepID=V9FYN7_PHYNI|nr:hypothetical protein F443_01503 [Phytophthora nicotianae P1569]